MTRCASAKQKVNEYSSTDDLLYVAPHRVDQANKRLAILKRFWKADKAAGGKNRVRTAGRVVQEIKSENPEIAVSVKTLYRWEKTYRVHGLIGLAGLRCRRLGRRTRGFVRLPEKLAKVIESQLLALTSLGLAFRDKPACDRGPDLWFVWRPLHLVLCDYVDAVGVENVDEGIVKP